MKDVPVRIPPMRNIARFVEMFPPEYFSPEMIIYNFLVQDEVTNELESQWADHLPRCQDETRRIHATATLEALFAIMKAGPDPFNQWLIQEKALDWPGDLLPLICDHLRTNRTESFPEFAIHVLFDFATRQHMDLEGVILGILGEIPTAYTLSLLCVLLGLIGSENAVPPIWRAYWYLRATKLKYINGPLLALGELADRARRREIGGAFLQS